jgi:hypothetical protein
MNRFPTLKLDGIPLYTLVFLADCYILRTRNLHTLIEES